MNKKILFYGFIAVILLNLHVCSDSKKNQTTDTIVVKVSELIKQKPAHTNLSQIVDSCKYVFLEVTDDCLIDKIKNLFLTEQYIIITGKKDCFAFDRNTGKFIRKIGNRGEGPNEYPMYIPQTVIDEANEKLYILSRDRKLLIYNINNGDLVNVVRHFCGNYSYKFRYMDLIDSIHYIGNISDIGRAKDRFITGTVYGDSIHVFPNYLFFTPKNGESVSLYSDMHFYHFKNKLYMKELLNDTLFHVRDPYTIYPKVIFDMDSHQFPVEFYGDVSRMIEEIKNYTIAEQVYESDDYLFFFIVYNEKGYGVLYDKNTGSGSLIDVAGEKQPLGFPNDIINGLPPFWPEFENNSGEMVACYSPNDLKEFFEENKFNNVSEELKNKIEHLTDDDNPVIVIVK